MGGKPLTKREIRAIEGDIVSGFTLREIIARTGRGAGSVNRVRQSLPPAQRGYAPGGAWRNQMSIQVQEPRGSDDDARRVAALTATFPKLQDIVDEWQALKVGKGKPAAAGRRYAVRFAGDLARVSDIMPALGFSSSSYTRLRNLPTVAPHSMNLGTGMTIVRDGEEIQPVARVVSLRGVLEFLLAHVGTTKRPLREPFSLLFSTTDVAWIRGEAAKNPKKPPKAEPTKAAPSAPPSAADPVTQIHQAPAGVDHVRRVETLLKAVIEDAVNNRAFDLAGGAMSLLSWFLSQHKITVRQPAR